MQTPLWTGVPEDLRAWLAASYVPDRSEKGGSIYIPQRVPIETVLKFCRQCGMSDTEGPWCDVLGTAMAISSLEADLSVWYVVNQSSFVSQFGDTQHLQYCMEKLQEPLYEPVAKAYQYCREAFRNVKISNRVWFTNEAVTHSLICTVAIVMRSVTDYQ